MSTGLVSILIPAFNSERWIQGTIQSALDQTWQNKEIIIVDDGSTDDTLNIARGFESKSVKVLTQENRGASSARNLAYRHAQGDYIQWLDADDLLDAGKIARQMETSDDGSTRVLLSSSWGRFYFRKKKAVFMPHALWRDLSPRDWLFTKFNQNISVHPAAWLVSRSLTERAGPWDERLSFDDDGEYFCRVVAVSENVRFVPGAKSFYRIGNTGSLSWGMSENAADSLFLSITLCIQHLLSLEDSSRTRAAVYSFLQRRLEYFYPEHKEFVKKMNDLSRELGGGSLVPRESRRFSLVKKMVGWDTAKKIKTLVWRAEIAARKNWDRTMHALFER